MFQEAAIESARKYYDFLTKNGRGIISCGVTKVGCTDGFVWLFLKSKLTSPESVQIKILNKTYTQHEIKPCEYDKDCKVLKVKPQNELLQLLAETEAKDISVISDLRFLVRRVEEWYKFYGSYLAIPSSASNVDISRIPVIDKTPSDDQQEAIRAIVSMPFTYIWGAPGTGKTRMVLASGILAYLLAGKKVLIVAPTNNAIEQTLYGLLDVLESIHHPLDSIMRMGVASSDFAQKYSSLCEDTSVAKYLTEISDQMVSVQNQIKENDRLIHMLPGARNYLLFKEQFEKSEPKISEGLERIMQLNLKLDGIGRDIDVLNGRILLIDTQKSRLVKEKDTKSYLVTRATERVQKHSGKLYKTLFRRGYQNDIDSLERAIQSLDLVEAQISEQISAQQKVKSEIDEKQKQIEQISAMLEKNHKMLCELSSYWTELYKMVTSIDVLHYSNGHHARYIALMEEGRKRLKDAAEKYSEVLALSETELLDKQEILASRYEELKKAKSESEVVAGKKVKNCKMLATTIDTCISRVLPNGDFQPDHIFLDEAGYCSLIKGVVLTAYGCPITFLGDHMQLPPVCEMNDDSFKEELYAPVSLWAQSAIYTEQALTEPQIKTYGDYLNHAPIHPVKMKQYDLIHTFRFGEALASVLASEVYANDFYGNIDCRTEIYYINIKRMKNQQKRTSSSECNAIMQYLKKTGETDVGILTPYTAQKDLVRLALRGKKEYEDSVMTVHGSQGREWSTVLFSVVDTTDKWFTNSLSQISNGKRVINTAVSRAKNKLILVCDADYWMTQKKQLIGKLLSVAQEYRFDI